MRGAAAYQTMMPRLLPQLLPAPHFVVLDALQQVGADFCEQSGVWRDALTEFVHEGDVEIPLSLPSGCALVRVNDFSIGGQRLDPGYDFSVSGTCIILTNPAHGQRDAIARVTLKPARMAEGLPQCLFEEWGDVICCGVLAKVKSMTGPRVDWTDAAGAQLNLGLYQEGIARARVRLLRGRDSRQLRIGGMA